LNRKQKNENVIMELFETLKVNVPNVVHETIDGETILLDLKSGNYFSLDGAGAVIWEFIDKTGNWGEVINIMTTANQKQKNNISNAIENFVKKLVEEQLLVKTDVGVKSVETPDLTKQLVDAAGDFKIPLVNKYSDMQDLLLLDPIHDVDEKGWPESKDNQPES